MKEFDELVKIIEKLRSPQGCPWDRKQTSDSLLSYLIEESNEVVDAIINKNSDHLKEELGDLLLQILLHSQIAHENNEFSIQDVVKTLSAKLINRHPHVFSDKEVQNADEVLVLWEEIKKKEKENEKHESILDKVPNNFPSILKSYKLQKAASKVGFDWSNYNDVLAKINEEIDELKDAIIKNNPEDIEHEFGDVMFGLINLSRFINVNPDVALSRANNRFIKRFKYVEKKVNESGRNFNDFSIEELENFWQEAKGTIIKDDK
jgi:tetrapyrrole methylase family protein/MazG family protein